MKVLITGAASQLAQEFTQAAKTKFELLPYKREELDLTDRERVETVLSTTKPAWILNLAAYTAVDKAETEPAAAFAVNALGVENLALSAQAHDIPILHLSTDYVFSGEKTEPYLT